MKPQKDRAKVNFNEAIIEICHRTGLPENAVYRILWTYAEIIKECLCNQVEIAFADLGTFGYQHHCERHDVKYSSCNDSTMSDGLSCDSSLDSINATNSQNSCAEIMTLPD